MKVHWGHLGVKQLPGLPRAVLPGDKRYNVKIAIEYDPSTMSVCSAKKLKNCTGKF